MDENFRNLNSNPLKGEEELNTFPDKRIVSKIFLKLEKKKRRKIHNVFDEASKRDDFNFKDEVKNGPINNRSSPPGWNNEQSPILYEKKKNHITFI